MVARAKLKIAKKAAEVTSNHADAIDEALTGLREAANTDGVSRDKRLACTDLLHHYRDTGLKIDNNAELTVTHELGASFGTTIGLRASPDAAPLPMPGGHPSTAIPLPAAEVEPGHDAEPSDQGDGGEEGM